jgi:hypothetical protein
VALVTGVAATVQRKIGAAGSLKNVGVSSVVAMAMVSHPVSDRTSASASTWISTFEAAVVVKPLNVMLRPTGLFAKSAPFAGLMAIAGGIAGAGRVSE